MKVQGVSAISGYFLHWTKSLCRLPIPSTSSLVYRDSGLYLGNIDKPDDNSLVACDGLEELGHGAIVDA